MRAIAFSILLLLGACASPSPEFFGVPEERVSVDGTSIAVFRKGDRAQAIRLTQVPWSDLPLMRARLFVSIERVTGCQAIAESADPPQGVRYDPAVLSAALSC